MLGTIEEIEKTQVITDEGTKISLMDWSIRVLKDFGNISLKTYNEGNKNFFYLVFKKYHSKEIKIPALELNYSDISELPPKREFFSKEVTVF